MQAHHGAAGRQELDAPHQARQVRRPPQQRAVEALDQADAVVQAGEDGPGHLGARAGAPVEQGGGEQDFAGVRRAVEEVAIGAVHEPLVGSRGGALAGRRGGGVRGQGHQERGPDGWRPAAADRPVRRLMTAIHRNLPILYFPRIT
jgi:hypothetical protein